MNTNINMNRFKKRFLSKSDVPRYDDNVISLTLFGSYNTEVWDKDRSDIDILVLLKHRDFDI